ncbi:aldehyde dehydrogenase family protein, partial [Klebsiella pneumoniae]|uniref:aldehyde dehydrogenase family protein n=1 Tax=Klebsiella pneumoniae TaxID=573 RepID=UPI000E2E9B62
LARWCAAVSRQTLNPRSVAQAKVEILNFAGEATRTYGQIIPSRARDVQQQTLKLPVGPVAAFTPWNFPINQ